MNGFRENIDFVWGPEWRGNEILPPCYLLRTWEDNEEKYDFSQAEGPWDYRYQELLTLINDRTVLSVMDCGSGNMSLKKMLGDNVLYYPIDKEKKYPETIVCDLNKGEFPDIYVDVSFLCGILEYVVCFDIFLHNVCQYSKTVLMTYCTLHTHTDVATRMQNGWVNHFTTGELVKIFMSNNFYLSDEIYEEKGGVYLRFDKMK